MTTKTASKPKTTPKTKSKVAAKSASKPANAKKVASKTAAKKSKSTTTAKSKSAPKKSVGSVKIKKSNNVSKNNGTNSRAILIQQMAYYIAEQRGFEGGDPVQDWLAAERRIDEMLNENRV